ERGDVVLDAVVVPGEGRRPQEVDRTVGSDQPAAREGRGRGEEEAECRRRESETETAEPSWMPWVSHRFASGRRLRRAGIDAGPDVGCLRLVPRPAGTAAGGSEP